MRNIVYWILSAFLTLAIAVVSLRYLTNFWLLSFIYSFQIHLGLTYAAASLVILAVRRHAYGVALLLVSLLLTAHGVIMLREFAEDDRGTGTAPLFRLMSFNVAIDNWKNSTAIADMVIASNADVVNLLEAKPLTFHLQRLFKVYPYHIGCDNGKDSCDTLVLSKRPFVTRQVASIGSLRKDRLVAASVDFGGQTVNLVSAHLTKPYYDDYQMEELGDLSKALDAISGPLVLSGDFNSSSIAPSIQALLRKQKLKTMAPEPATWPIAADRYGIAIDHIFARAPLHLTSLKRLDDNLGSNHSGLIAEFIVDRSGETAPAQ
ncbi:MULTISPECIES: endonuclease/exonuclease/phosphatase family protein [unclassified Rhizobium]|uniref:endonuclease/exonuclease/phosphatase family protein n=1 Tax=unclassified Rhizobium TaxID=2613769 RepID=UPI001C83A242|nr:MULTISPECIES: endonuclease/exonuclease/phosphatase family protein [unclassified Rhizobium]MBX5215908.1 endonuclease [Rhizobium sp. NLR9a]MBX5222546.1 endonuclease [Rhizobium sp. NLR8a]MBX5242150.1 endonuclease [Rhizobium sp. NLR22b]MBX5246606.1 endonuclease [Rhizobium sp. NLR3b]MBX5277208.1 endonuclease [Rhizobium sp. NLR13a]